MSAHVDEVAVNSTGPTSGRAGRVGGVEFTEIADMACLSRLVKAPVA